MTQVESGEGSGPLCFVVSWFQHSIVGRYVACKAKGTESFTVYGTLKKPDRVYRSPFVLFADLGKKLDGSKNGVSLSCDRVWLSNAEQFRAETETEGIHPWPPLAQLTP